MASQTRKGKNIYRASGKKYETKEGQGYCHKKQNFFAML